MIGGLSGLTSLTGGGALDAGGGSAGPSGAGNTSSNGFSVTGINMGGGSNKTLLVLGAIAVAVLVTMKYKK